MSTQPERAAGTAPQALCINPEELPKHFESADAERRWDAAWQASGIYYYDPARPREEVIAELLRSHRSITLNLESLYSVARGERGPRAVSGKPA